MKELVDLCISKGYDRFHPEWFVNNELNVDTWYLELCLLQKWLREKHNLIVTIELIERNEPKYCYDIVKYIGVSDFKGKTDCIDWVLHKTYEQALEKGLFEAVNYVTR